MRLVTDVSTGCSRGRPEPRGRPRGRPEPRGEAERKA